MNRNFYFFIFYFFVNCIVYIAYSKIKINRVANLNIFPSISFSVPYIAKDRIGEEEHHVQINKTLIFRDFSLRMNIPEAKTYSVITAEDINLNKFFSYGYNIKINEELLSDVNCISSPKIIRYVDKNNQSVVKLGSDFKKLYMSKRLVKGSYCFKKEDLNSLIINFDFFGNDENFIKINNNIIFENNVNKKKNLTYYSIGILILLTLLFSSLAYFLNIFVRKDDHLLKN
jgi:hypothetical protein